MYKLPKPPHLYITTGKTIALTIQTFVGKVMSLLLNMLSRFVIAFLPRSKHLLMSWLYIYIYVFFLIAIKMVKNPPVMQETWV